MTRDEMFSKINELSEQIATVLAPLQKRQLELEAEIEEQERPKKQLEIVLQQKAIAQAQLLDEKFRLQREVRQAAPEFLTAAIADAKSQADAGEARACNEPSIARRVALRERAAQARKAEHALELLVMRPGDLRPAVTQILTDLALSALDSSPAAPSAEPAPAAPRRRPQYAEASIES